MTVASSERGSAGLLRGGLIGLIALGMAGTAVELLFLRHWGSAAKTVVWLALVAIGAAAFLVAARPSPRVITVARTIGMVVGVVALAGIWFHVSENLIAGPLDRRFAATWDSMSPLSQWWAAITGGVGPAPTLAPGAVLQLALGLLLATVRPPATRTAPSETRCRRAPIAQNPLIARAQPGDN